MIQLFRDLSPRYITDDRIFDRESHILLFLNLHINDKDFTQEIKDFLKNTLYDPNECDFMSNIINSTEDYVYFTINEKRNIVDTIDKLNKKFCIFIRRFSELFVEEDIDIVNNIIQKLHEHNKLDVSHFCTVRDNDIIVHRWVSGNNIYDAPEFMKDLIINEINKYSPRLEHNLDIIVPLICAKIMMNNNDFYNFLEYNSYLSILHAFQSKNRLEYLNNLIKEKGNNVVIDELFEQDNLMHNGYKRIVLFVRTNNWFGYFIRPSENGVWKCNDGKLVLDTKHRIIDILLGDYVLSRMSRKDILCLIYLVGSVLNSFSHSMCNKYYLKKLKKECRL